MFFKYKIERYTSILIKDLYFLCVCIQEYPMLLLWYKRCNRIREDPYSHPRRKTLHETTYDALPTISCFSLSPYVYLLFSFVLIHFANSMRSVYVQFNAISNTEETESLCCFNELPNKASPRYKKRGNHYHQLHHISLLVCSSPV